MLLLLVLPPFQIPLSLPHLPSSLLRTATYTMDFSRIPATSGATLPYQASCRHATAATPILLFGTE